MPFTEMILYLLGERNRETDSIAMPTNSRNANFKLKHPKFKVPPNYKQFISLYNSIKHKNSINEKSVLFRDTHH